MQRPGLEVADVVREHRNDYVERYGAVMSLQQRRVLNDVVACRTAALGGHVEACDQCGHQQISYNSCCNRHCPKCQSLAKAKWLEKRRGELLPVEYYHVVFTVPRDLASLALQNKRVVYGILFRAASRALLTLAADPKHLGAKVGILAILHTWGQNVLHHPHLHCVVTGGGLSPDGTRWISCRKGFLLPVRVLSRLFRRMFLDELREAYDEGRLRFGGDLTKIAEEESFIRLISSCRAIEWVVYAKRPFGGPEKVLDYLGRYTHRVAISNHRLRDMRCGKLTFELKDYANDGEKKTMTLDAVEFIRRFLLHVLPSGFVRIRYYGLLASCHKAANLERCRQLLGVEEKLDDLPASSDSQEEEEEEEVEVEVEVEAWVAFVRSLTGKDPLACPACKDGRMVHVETLWPLSTVVPEGIDSS